MGITVGFETKNGVEIKKKFGTNVSQSDRVYNTKKAASSKTSAQVASLGNSPASDSFTSSVTGKVGSGNTCTDGRDDGKISLFSKAANVVQGVARSGANMVKAAVSHPFKTAAVIGVGFIPVVGPALLGGLACYGALQGAKEVVGAVKLANAADNDADAKAAWEHIGSGTFTTALSVAGAKASAKALKHQIGGGSDTVRAIHEGNAKTLREIAKKAKNETIQNGKDFVSKTKEKLAETKDNLQQKAQDFKKQADLGKGKEYLKEQGQGYIDKKRYGDKASDVQQARDKYKEAKQELKTAKEELKNATSENLEAAKNNVKNAREKLDGKEGLKQKYKNTKNDSTIKAQKKQHAEDVAKKLNKEAKDQIDDLCRKKPNEITKNNDGTYTQQWTEKANGVETTHTVQFDKNGFKKSYEISKDGNVIDFQKFKEGTTAYGDTSGKIAQETTLDSDGTKTTTTDSTTKDGVQKHTEQKVAQDGKVQSNTKKSIGKTVDRKTVEYQKTAQRNEAGGIDTIETYTAPDGTTSIYKNGKLDSGVELTGAQKQLLKLNAKIVAPKEINAATLYTYQASAINSERYE